eukprot:scaffold843_cov330-Pavlova_lutheri.AAC.34
MTREQQDRFERFPCSSCVRPRIDWRKPRAAHMRGPGVFLLLFLPPVLYLPRPRVRCTAWLGSALAGMPRPHPMVSSFLSFPLPGPRGSRPSI